MSEIAKYNEVIARLGKKPEKKHIKVNTQARGAKYIPIGIIEAQLDNVYSGLWQIKNFRWEVIVNEIIGSLELHVFIPDVGWIIREGAGAVPIQLAKGSSVTQVDKKIYNTLVKDFPHLKSECLKNASKSLGVLFGRDLNRKSDDIYQPDLNTPDNEMILDWQMVKIDALLHNSTIETNIKEGIEAEVPNMTSKRANNCITYLKDNQKPTLKEDLDNRINEPGT